MTRIVVLPGDGIGPEVTAQAVQCLKLVSEACALDFSFEEHDFGGAAIDAHGTPLPAATLEACRDADGILLGAIGGPQWDSCTERPEDGLLALRKALNLFANRRPARVIPGLEEFSPLKSVIAAGADVLVVRELTGGLYFGEKKHGAERASDLCVYSVDEIERIAHIAFRAAHSRRGRVTSVDKANVLATSRLWRSTVNRVATSYPNVTLDHLYVDAAAMALVTSPTRFDVILTENLFGDILSDELAVISGSIGLLGSSSSGSDGASLFEPIHGSAPDIAGQDKANPGGAISSAAMLLEDLGFSVEAEALVAALEQALRDGCRTTDLGGNAGCAEFGARVRQILTTRLARNASMQDIFRSNRGCCG